MSPQSGTRSTAPPTRDQDIIEISDDEDSVPLPPLCSTGDGYSTELELIRARRLLLAYEEENEELQAQMNGLLQIRGVIAEVQATASEVETRIHEVLISLQVSRIPKPRTEVLGLLKVDDFSVFVSAILFQNLWWIPCCGHAACYDCICQSLTKAIVKRVRDTPNVPFRMRKIPSSPSVEFLHKLNKFFHGQTTYECLVCSLRFVSPPVKAPALAAMVKAVGDSVGIANDGNVSVARGDFEGGRSDEMEVVLLDCPVGVANPSQAGIVTQGFPDVHRVGVAENEDTEYWAMHTSDAACAEAVGQGLPRKND
ncbi:hypothetical protein BV25DRAFT_1835149 [Artomyces pyxidatus]|uniref:Uncharacterized protein n=1 Tax=Artomyces pyxidatus TaxID=48021 RepID=A0ACB8TGD7_9AGAM|nr:hypothetical protein BV25DRAFT_1835149 [Artomyces pyxidatus]